MANTLQELKGQKPYSSAVGFTPVHQVSKGEFYAVPPGEAFSIQESRRGIFDALRGLVGFYTKSDEFNDQLKLRQLEHDQQLETMEYENFYNSPSQAAMRMRSAGLNPDLLGLSGVSDASSYNEPEQGLGVPQSDDPNMIDLINGVSGFASTVQSMISAGLSIQRMKEGIRSDKIDNLQKLFNTASDIFGKVSDDLDIDNKFQAGVTALSYDYFGRGRRAKKFAEDFSKAFDAFRKSNKGKSVAYANKAEFETNRRSVASLLADPNYREFDNELKEALKPMVDLIYKTSMSNLRVQDAIANYQYTVIQNKDAVNEAGAFNSENETAMDKNQYLQNYYSNLNGGLAALSENERNDYTYDLYHTSSGKLEGEARNAHNKLTKTLDEENAAMHTIRHDALQALYQRYRDGDIMAGIGLALLSRFIQGIDIGMDSLPSLITR